MLPLCAAAACKCRSTLSLWMCMAYWGSCRRKLEGQTRVFDWLWVSATGGHLLPTLLSQVRPSKQLFRRSKIVAANLKISPAVGKSALLCRSCNGRLVYQGDADSVFNYSNHFLITYELGFVDHADSMCEGKVSFSLHFRCLLNRCRHANVPLDQLMSRGTYRYACT